MKGTSADGHLELFPNMPETNPEENPQRNPMVRRVAAKGMTMDEYQRLASRTANMDHEKVLERLRQNPRLIELLNFALGAAGEAGELADDVKKVVFHGHELDAKKLQKETGDALWYLSQVAKALGYNLGAVAEANIEKLRQRYPEGFSEEASKARVDTLPMAEEAVENMRQAINETDLRRNNATGWGD